METFYQAKKTGVSVSIVSGDFANMASEFQALEKSGADWYHLDVMDGAFVPNITFGAPIIKKLRPHSDLFFDTHLMVEEPIRYITDFVEAGSNLISVHVEACKDIRATLSEVKNQGLPSGVVINPQTPTSEVTKLSGLFDLVLVMSVNPGFSGQSYIPVEEKVKELSNFRQKEGLNFDIEVDGGVSDKNASTLREAGANVLVSASYIFKNKSSDGLYHDPIKKLKN